MTQGGLLSAKLFNIMVEAVVREWIRLLWEEMDMKDEAKLDEMMETPYQRMCTRCTPAAIWDAHIVTCRECGKDMRASSLGRHLVDQHEIPQMQVVAKELLDRREGVVYEIPLGFGKLKYPFPLCKGELASGWIM